MVDCNQERLIDVLAATGADVNPKDVYCYTPLHTASILGILSDGADKKCILSDGRIRLLLAKGDKVPAVEALVMAGAAVNQPNHPIRTSAVGLAANEGYLDILQALTRNRAGVNAEDVLCYSVLLRSSQERQSGCHPHALGKRCSCQRILSHGPHSTLQLPPSLSRSLRNTVPTRLT